MILSVDDVDVHDLNHLINLISLKEIGTSVNLVVFRDGKRIRAELKVIDLDRSHRSAEMSTPVIPGEEAPQVDLGLSLQPLDDSLADQLGYGTGTAGLLVLNVDADSPLAAADLQLYDVIEEVSRQSVDSVDAFQTALQTSESKPLLLKVRRQTNGKSTSHLVLMNP